jgi:hypothetical protein
MMQVELMRQVIGLEYEALALAAGPLTTLAVGWLARQATTRLRDQRAAGYTARLVAWAAQVIPDKSARYAEVAGLLSRRFPMLSGEQIEVLIESEVLGLKSALRTAAPASSASSTTVPVAPASPAQAAPLQSTPAQSAPLAEGDGTAGLRVGA